MQVKVTLDLEELKRLLCPGCQKTLDRYLKELAIEALKKDTQEAKE